MPDYIFVSRSTCINKGAEAGVFISDYLGKDAVVKIRSPKRYRHKELDSKLRSSRTKNEIKVMIEARKAGVRTPYIYDVDTEECSITMENIHGPKIRDALDSGRMDATDICRKIGESIAKLHNSGISHGDLTTSNMILTDSGEICFIDFSLGSSAAEIEDIGVDMHLLKRAFSSAHSNLDNEFTYLLKSYSENVKEPKKIFDRVEDIKNRGRYT